MASVAIANSHQIGDVLESLLDKHQVTTELNCLLGSEGLRINATLVAADPNAGTWKLNLEKSKYKTGTPPKEQTLTIAEAGSDLDVTLSGTAADGAAIMSHYTVPAEGGEGKIIQSPYEAVSGKRMGPNEREITLSKGGKDVLTAHSRVSAVRRTMISSTLSRINPKSGSRRWTRLRR